MLKKTMFPILVAGLLAAPPVLAQDTTAEPAVDAAADSPEAIEAAEAVADVEAEVQDEEDEVEAELDPNDPLYWAKLREVYTVQKRDFQKQGRVALTLYGGLIPNNAFEKYLPVGARVNYFILENLGLELAGSYAFKMDTNLQPTLQEEASRGGVGAQQVLVGDRQLSHVNFGVVWSPIYGKTAFYSSALNYFDFYLFAGAGMVITETQPDFNAPAQQDYKPEGALGAGLAYYLGEHAALRVDFRQFVFQKVEGVGGVANPSEVSLGFGWFL